MTPQERDLITILLGRLNKIKGQPQDPEAETLVRETIAVRADTAYSLVQAVLIQDLSLHNAQNRIIDLETQLTEMKRAASALRAFLALRASLARSSAALNLQAAFGRPNCRATPGPASVRSQRSRVMAPKAALQQLPLLALD